MSNVKEILKETSIYLKKLYENTGYFANGDIKDSVIETQNYLKICLEKEEFECDKLMAPFLLASNKEGSMKEISLNYFTFLFKNSTEDRRPNDKIMVKLLKSMSESPISQGDGLNYATVKMFSAVFVSSAFSSISHGNIIYITINYAIQMYKLSYGKPNMHLIKSEIFLMFNGLLKATFNSKKETEESSDIYSRFKGLDTVEKMLQDCIDPIPEGTKVADVDLAISLSVLVHATESDTSESIILNLLMEILYAIVYNETPMHDRPFYASLLSSVYAFALRKALSNTKVEELNVGNLITTIHSKGGRIVIEPIINFLNIIIDQLKRGEHRHRTTRIIDIISYSPNIFFDIQLYHPEEQILYKFVDILSQNTRHSDFPSMYAMLTMCFLLRCMYTKPVFESLIENKPVEGEKEEFTLFRDHPAKALNQLMEENIIPSRSAEELTKYLYEEEGLDKKVKGRLLGQQKPRFIYIYINNIGIEGKTYFELFQETFSSAYPPVNLSLLDSLFTSFTRTVNRGRYFSQSNESLYVLTFNTFILYNNLHTKDSDNYITFEKFVDMNNNYTEGVSVRDELLREVYDSVRDNEIFPITQIPQLMCYNDMAINYRNFNKTVRERGLTKEDKFFLANDLTEPCRKYIIHALELMFRREKIDPLLHVLCNIFYELSSNAAVNYDSDVFIEITNFFIKNTHYREQAEGLSELDFMLSKTFIKCIISNYEYIPCNFDMDTFFEEAVAFTRATNKYALMQKMIYLSGNLNYQSTESFIKAMVNVARTELLQEEPITSTTMLIPDFVEANSARPLFVWLKLWDPIKKFIIEFGESRNVQTADLIVSIGRNIFLQFVKFSQQKCLCFQSHFLEPFLTIFDNQLEQFIREKIVGFVYDIAISEREILRSAWDVIFQIMTSASINGISFNVRKELLNFVASELVGFIQPYVVHLMMFASMHILHTTDEDEAANQISVFVEIAQNMANVYSNPYKCLFDYFKSFVNDGRKKVIIASQEALIKILDKRTNIPEEAINFFINEVLKDTFIDPKPVNIKNCRELLSVLEEHEEYNKWNDSFVLLKKFIDDEEEKINKEEEEKLNAKQKAVRNFLNEEEDEMMINFGIRRRENSSSDEDEEDYY